MVCGIKHISDNNIDNDDDDNDTHVTWYQTLSHSIGRNCPADYERRRHGNDPPVGDVMVV